MKYVRTSYNTGYKKNDNTVRIYHFINLNKKRIKLAGNVYVNIDLWDESSAKVRGKSKLARDLNLLLEKERGIINEILIRYRLSGRDLSVDKLKKEFHNPDVYTDFNAWLKYTIDQRKDIEIGTIKIHLTLLHDLEEYDKELLFADITPKFLKSFNVFLKKKGNSINTRNKKMRSLKSYMNIAIQEEMINKNPFDDFTIEKGKGRINYLEKKEVKIIKDKLIAGQFNETQSIAARNWLASFYLCGMPRADFVRFTTEWISNDVVMYVRHKTRRKERVIKIPLTRSAKEMIKEACPNRISGIVFKTFTDQFENRMLKEVAKLCKIEKPLTFHVARHTFATLFYEATGDIATLQQLLGHSKITETMIYAHVSEQKKKDLIKKFENGIMSTP